MAEKGGSIGLTFRKCSNREEVVTRWLRGLRGANGTGNLATDGATLFSYMVPIAVRHGQEVEVTTLWYSMTTAQHVGLAKRVAARMGLEVREASVLLASHWDLAGERQ